MKKKRQLKRKKNYDLHDHSNYHSYIQHLQQLSPYLQHQQPLPHHNASFKQNIHRPKSSIDQIQIKKIKCTPQLPANLIQLKQNGPTLRTNCQSLISVGRKKSPLNKKNKSCFNQIDENDESTLNMCDYMKTTEGKGMRTNSYLESYNQDIFSNKIKQRRSITPKYLPSQDSQLKKQIAIKLQAKKKLTQKYRVSISKSKEKCQKSKEKSSQKKKKMKKSKKVSGRMKQKQKQKQGMKKGKSQKKSVGKGVKKKKVKRSQIVLQTLKQLKQIKQSKLNQLIIDQDGWDNFLNQSSQIIQSSFLKSKNQQTFGFRYQKPTLHPYQYQEAAIIIQRFWRNYKLSCKQKIISQLNQKNNVNSIIELVNSKKQQLKQRQINKSSCPVIWNKTQEDVKSKSQDRDYEQQKMSAFMQIKQNESPYFQKLQLPQEQKVFSNFTKGKNINKFNFSSVFSTSRKTEEQTYLLSKRKSEKIYKQTIMPSELKGFIKQSQIKTEIKQILLQLVSLGQKQGKKKQKSGELPKIIQNNIQEQVNIFDDGNISKKFNEEIGNKNYDIILSREEALFDKYNKKITHLDSKKNKICVDSYMRQKKGIWQWYSKQRKQLKKSEKDIRKGCLKAADEYKKVKEDIFFLYKDNPNHKLLCKSFSEKGRLGEFYSSIYSPYQSSDTTSTKSLRKKMLIRRSNKIHLKKNDENIRFFTFDGADVKTEGIVETQAEKFIKMNDFFAEKQDDHCLLVDDTTNQQLSPLRIQEQDLVPQQQKQIWAYVDNGCNEENAAIICQKMHRELYVQAVMQILGEDKFRRQVSSRIMTNFNLNQVYYAEYYLKQIGQMALSYPFRQKVSSNLNQQIGTKPTNILKYARSYDLYDLQDDQQYAVQPALPNQIFIIHNKNHKITSQYIQLANKLLFDSLNDSLDYERPYGYYGKPLPWQHHFVSKPKQVQMEKVFENGKKRMLCWLQQKRGSIDETIDEVLLLEKRLNEIQKYVEKQLHNDEQWMNFDDQLLQNKINISNQIFDHLCLQLIKQIL